MRQIPQCVLSPDPADLRMGCKFLFAPAIQSTRSGRGKIASFGPPPRAAHRQGTVSSKQSTRN
eukprot:6925055-Pyramimonas_sp.AAC.1